MMSIVAQGGRLVSGSPLTIEKLYASNDRGTVGFLVKNGCQEQVSSLHLVILKELWGMCENTFTTESLVDTAMMISQQYPHHMPQELIVVIKNGLAGKYGKTYGKVSTIEVMRWIKEYDEFERLSYFENKDKGKEIGWNEMNPDLLKKIFKPEAKKSDTTTTKSAYIPRKRTEQEELIQLWMKEFDGIYKAQNIGKIDESPIKFIIIKENQHSQLNLSIEEYLVYRMMKNK